LEAVKACIMLVKALFIGNIMHDVGKGGATKMGGRQFEKGGGA